MGFQRRRRRTRRGEPVDQPQPPADDDAPTDPPPEPDPEPDPAGTPRHRRAPSPADFAGVQTTPIADPPPHPAPHPALPAPVPQPAPAPRPVPPHGSGPPRGQGWSHGSGLPHGSDHADAAGDGVDVESERGLRGLVGSGSSQVSLTAAMRARDAARPDDAELATTAAELTIVRRNWTPRDDSRGRALPPGTR